MLDDNPMPSRRSAGALGRARIQLPWPEDRTFRILSIDGGGIRGVFPASFLEGLEKRYLRGRSVNDYFDLIAGTSTGGIIALGLAAGLDAVEIRDLYVERGCEIFPPVRSGFIGSIVDQLRNMRQYFRYRYDRDALMRLLSDTFGDRKFGTARTRLCIPSADGRYGEAYIFKTPHHPDFTRDAREPMTKVAAATAAAPTFFQPLESGGYTFVDGGIFSNDPIMVALVDALSCFSVSWDRVRILSLGCSSERCVVDGRKLKGGNLAWRRIIDTSIQLQSFNAQGQAGLLIGADHIVRVAPPPTDRRIELDDWRRAVDELAPAAEKTLDEMGKKISDKFLSEPVLPYKRSPDGAGARSRTMIHRR